MKRWWLLVILGCFLLYLTLGACAAIAAFLLALATLWFAQMRKIDLLCAKIQGDIKKLEGILKKWFS